MTRLRLFIIALAIAFNAYPESLEEYLQLHRGDIAEGFSIADVAQTASNDDNVIGVWALRFDGDSGLFALVRDPYSGFIKMIVVDAAVRSVTPGSLMGVMAQAAATDFYNAQIFSSVSPDGKLSNPKKFTLHFTTDHALTFKPVNNRWVANWWRLIPYMGRISIHKEDNTDKNINGAVRILPYSKPGAEGVHLL